MNLFKRLFFTAKFATNDKTTDQTEVYISSGRKRKNAEIIDGIEVYYKKPGEKTKEYRGKVTIEKKYGVIKKGRVNWWTITLRPSVGDRAVACIEDYINKYNGIPGSI
ncbi:MAG: hypothetical protein A2Z35_03775 [Actinobacteria bacterium RBG_19FT_COMBO_36_27]|nr:MAG: hypothetical protein A2Z35_03775 [Actinobacteria bacterium RBG_19FT_COMBO_36_27]